MAERRWRSHVAAYPSWWLAGVAHGLATLVAQGADDEELAQAMRAYFTTLPRHMKANRDLRPSGPITITPPPL